jgi:lipoprotein-anchoring transpeptidase ErfK/SrfK
MIFPEEPPPAKQTLFEWADDGGPGELAVTLDLTRQIATYERGGRPLGWSFICSGKPGHLTPLGNFTITEKMDLKLSSHYGWLQDASGNVTNGDATPATPVPAGEFYVPAPMPHWMRLTAYGVGMHGGLIPQPGQTASHGCVRLPMDFAPKLYEAVKVGTPVKIVASEAQAIPASAAQIHPTHDS